MSVRIDPVTEFGVFDRPLRNIRASLDEERLILDLIPQTTRLISRKSQADMGDAVLTVIYGNDDVAREIVESDTCLRVCFDPIWAWVVHGEFSDSGFPEVDMSGWPRIGESKVHYPFARVTGSPWLAKVPDYELPADGNFVHFRILSATTYMDIISTEPEGEWVENVPGER
jgi:hypothetical protein